MDQTARLEAAALCRALLMRYATAIDRRDFDKFVGTFAPEGVFRCPGQPPLVGREAIRALLLELDASRRARNPNGHLQRHMFTTVDIEVVDADAAHPIAYALAWRDGDWDGKVPARMRQPDLLIEYRDRFTRTQEGWRLADHEAIHLFSTAAQEG